MARIPDTYQEVEYLRGTGTQYIRTSYFATGNTSIKIKFRVNELQGYGIFGSRDTTTPTNAYLMWGAGAGFWRAQYGNQNFVSEIERDTEWHTWEQRKNACFLDGKWFYTFEKQTFQNTYEQLLFGIGSNATTMIGLYIGKDDIGVVEYWENDELTMQLIPCYRKSDKTAGYYDTVLHEFLTNAGTGNFEVGPDVNKPDLRMMYWKGKEELPNEYQEVEYIEGTGTQYIDTGIIGKTGVYKIRTKIRTSDNISGLQSIYGVRKDSGNTRFMLGFYTSSNQIKFDFAINTDNFGQVVSKNTDYEFEADYRSTTKTLKINGVDDISSTDSLDTTGNIFLFGYNRMWQQTSQMTSFFVGRVYNFEIIDSNNNLIMKLVPCFRKSDNSVGMFDLISSRFLSNLGTGAFNKGACVSLPSEYQEVEYIQSDGNQYINTGYTGNLETEVNYHGKFISAPAQFFQVFGNNVTNTRALTVNLNITGNSATSRFGNKNASMSYKVPNDTVITLKLNKDVFGYVDNKGYIQTSQMATTTAFTTNGTLWLMFVNDGSYRGVSQFYGATIVQAGEIVRNYKPCYRKSDGVIGVYDMITGSFLTNAGTGTFTKGKNVPHDLRFFYAESNKLPSEYQALEYLDTDNQYFETILDYEACTIEQVVKFESDTRRRLIGWGAFNTRYWGVDALNRYEMGSSNVISADEALATDWHNVKFTTNGKLTAPTATVLIDDKFSTTRLGSGGATLSNYDYLKAATEYRAVAYFKFIKKILPDGTVKNNLRPCVRKSDNKVGWYDLVTEQFLPNNCKAGQYKKTLRIIYM